MVTSAWWDQDAVSQPLPKNLSFSWLWWMTCAATALSPATHSHVHCLRQSGCTIQLQVCYLGSAICSIAIKSTYMHELAKQLNSRAPSTLDSFNIWHPCSGVCVCASECESQLICYYEKLQNMVHNWIHYKKTQWLFFKFEFSFYHHAKISLQVGPPNMNLANYAHVQIQYLLLNSHLQNLSWPRFYMMEVRWTMCEGLV